MHVHVCDAIVAIQPSFVDFSLEVDKDKLIIATHRVSRDVYTFITNNEGGIEGLDEVSEHLINQRLAALPNK